MAGGGRNGSHVRPYGPNHLSPIAPKATAPKPGEPSPAPQRRAFGFGSYAKPVCDVRPYHRRRCSSSQAIRRLFQTESETKGGTETGSFALTHWHGTPSQRFWLSARQTSVGNQGLIRAGRAIGVVVIGVVAVAVIVDIRHVSVVVARRTQPPNKHKPIACFKPVPWEERPRRSRPPPQIPHSQATCSGRSASCRSLSTRPAASARRSSGGRSPRTA